MLDAFAVIIIASPKVIHVEDAFFCTRVSGIYATLFCSLCCLFIHGSSAGPLTKFASVDLVAEWIQLPEEWNLLSFYIGLGCDIGTCQQIGFYP
jgi:hypothetical protein